MTSTKNTTDRNSLRPWRLLAGLLMFVTVLRITDSYDVLYSFLPKDTMMYHNGTGFLDKEMAGPKLNTTEHEKPDHTIDGNTKYSSNKSGQGTHFSPWVQDYISFHQSSIENGKLKDGVNYLIYECIDGPNRCGGAGDRLIAMIKMFYLAMMTNRVLLIDAPFPIQLSEVFNPAHIEWNASFPETLLYFPDLDYNISINTRKEILGYRIPRTNGIPRKTGLDELWNSKLMAQHFIRGNWTNQALNITLARVAHEAFTAMFQFTTAVENRSQELKAAAGILGLYNITAPFVGMHLRTGDTHMGIGRHETGFNASKDAAIYLNCYQTVKLAHPGQVELAYLASDNDAAKKLASKADTSVHFVKDMNPFHIDLSTRQGVNVKKTINPDATSVYNGVIDTWAEMFILAESTCLVLTKSMFVVASSIMRDPRSCSVPLDRCNSTSFEKESNLEFFAEHINERGFIISTGTEMMSW